MKNNHNNSQEKKKELTKTIIMVQETAKNCLNKMYNDDTISYEKFSEKLSAKIYEGDNIIDRTSMSNWNCQDMCSRKIGSIPYFV